MRSFGGEEGEKTRDEATVCDFVRVLPVERCVERWDVRTWLIGSVRCWGMLG